MTSCELLPHDASLKLIWEERVWTVLRQAEFNPCSGACRFSTQTGWLASPLRSSCLIYREDTGARETKTASSILTASGGVTAQPLEPLFRSDLLARSKTFLACDECCWELYYPGSGWHFGEGQSSLSLHQNGAPAPEWLCISVNSPGAERSPRHNNPRSSESNVCGIDQTGSSWARFAAREAFDLLQLLNIALTCVPGSSERTQLPHHTRDKTQLAYP